MKEITEYLSIHRRAYIEVLALVALASCWQGLTFGFWKDDWHLLWEALYSPQSFYDWLHPAIFVEFWALAPIFGTHPFWWQLIGIFLRVAMAFVLSMFTLELTGSSVASIIAGIAYASTFGSLDATTWLTAHHMLWAALFMVEGFRNFIRFLKKNYRSLFIASILYIILGLFSDPYQSAPVLLLIPVLPVIVLSSGKAHKVAAKILKIEVIFVAAAIVAGYFTVRKFIYGSQLYLHFMQNHSLIYVLSKVYLIGNYFNSLANLLLGWAIPISEDASTGTYNRIVARVGFIIFCATIGVAYGYWKTKSRAALTALFTLLWIFLSYIPDWLFEPRLTMGGTHRYFGLSEIGCILLVSYLLSRIRDSRIVVVLTALFILGNIVTSNRLLFAESRYRSEVLVNKIVTTINADVPPRASNLIFVYSGEDPVKTYAMSLTGAFPFAIDRHLTTRSDIPLVSEDTKLIQDKLCNRGVPLNHVFGWNITKSGILTNSTPSLRKELLTSALSVDCVPSIDEAMIIGNR